MSQRAQALKRLIRATSDSDRYAKYLPHTKILLTTADYDYDMKRRDILKAASVASVAAVQLPGTSGAVEDIESGGTVWVSDAPDDIMLPSPTVVNGSLYIGSNDNSLYCIDIETGETEWVYEEAKSCVATTTSVVDGRVYAGSHDTNVYCIDEDTGENIWTYTEPEDTVANSANVYKGNLYFADFDEIVYSVDAKTGETVWTSEEIDGYPRSRATVTDDTIYFGTGSYKNPEEGSVYAMDARDGELLWEFVPGREVLSSPTVVDGTVYVGCADGNLYALDRDTGKEEWRYEEPSDRVDSSPTAHEGSLYFGSNDTTLYCLDIESGELDWKFDKPDRMVASAPTVANGTVYFGTGAPTTYDTLYQVEQKTGGDFYAVDAETGEIEWEYTEVEGGIPCGPIVVDGVVYFGANDERIYAVSTSEDGSSEGSRIDYGTLNHHFSYASAEANRVSYRGVEGKGTEQRDTNTPSTSGESPNNESGNLSSQNGEGLPGFTAVAGVTAIASAILLKRESEKDN
jgi:outer membrane protein assembly factor BamB